MPTIDFSQIIAAKLNGSEVVRITDTVNTLWEKQQADYNYLSFTDVSNAQNTLTLSRVGTEPASLYNIALEYSFDKQTWQTWTEDANYVRTLTIPAGGTVYLRGDNLSINLGTDNYYYNFASTANVAAGGDLRSLRSKTLNQSAMPNNFGRCLFKGMTTLTKAPAIGFTTIGAGSCRSMFDGCTSLSDVSLIDLSSFSIGSGATALFYWMFRGCTSITAAPRITITTTASSILYGTFRGCTALTSAANVTLNATSLSNYAYGETFRGCSSLSVLPSITQSPLSINTQSLSGTFQDCTSITAAPAMEIGSITSGTFFNCSVMFSGCTSLVDASDLVLSAPSLTKACYKQMFYGCTAMTDAPEIQATTLADGDGDSNNSCCAYMFSGCSSLNHIKVAFTDWNSDAASNNLYCYSWVNGVAASGIFECPSALPTTTGSSYIPTGWTVDYTDSQKSKYFSINDESGAANTIKLIGTSGSVEASSDNGTTWNEITASSAGTEISLPANGKVLFKHTGDMNGMKFDATGNYSVWGNIDSLIHGDNFGDGGTSGSFHSMFSESTKLVSAEKLYIGYTTVGHSKMTQMFKGCTALVTPPSLKSVTKITENSSMHSMFQDCTSMTTPPDLSGLTDLSGTWSHGLRMMFQGCTSLTEGADLSGITTVGDRTFLNMYNGCTALVTPSDLSRITTVGNSSCSMMYYGCTSLKTASHMPALTTVTANSAFGDMYNGCTALEEPADMPLLASVSGTGTFSNMYRNCTSLKRVPDLHSVTRVLSNAMSSMFYGCTSLRKGLDISGITVNEDSNVFNYMYYGCTNLFEAYCGTANGSGSGNFSNYLTNVASYGVIHGNPNGNNYIGVHPSNWVGEYIDPTMLSDEDEYFAITTGDIVVGSPHITITGDDSDTIDYSINDGSTWTTITPSSGGTNIVVSRQWKVMFRHIGAMNGMRFDCDKAFAVSGNIDSLIHGDNFVQSGATMPARAFQDLFAESNKLVSAEHLYLGAYDTVGEMGMVTMFSECTHLLKAPDCSHFTEIGQQGMDGLLNDEGLFRNCKCLAEGVDISNVESIGWRGLFSLNGGCSVMDKAYLPNLLDKTDVDWWSLFGAYMENNYPSGTMYADASWYGLIPISDTNIVPSGWDVEYTGDVKPNAVSSNGYVTATPMNQGDSIQYKIGNGEWTAYTAAITWNTIGVGNTVYFRELNGGTAYSGNTSVTVNSRKCSAPRITADDNSLVTIQPNNEAYANVSIRYTTDGTTPTSSSTLYTAPFTVQNGTTIKAVCIPSNTTWYTDSDVDSLTVNSLPTFVNYVYDVDMSDNFSNNKLIDTQVAISDTSKMRVESQYCFLTTWSSFVGYHNSGFDEYIGLAAYEGGVQWKWGDEEHSSNLWYDFYETTELDITFDKTVVYDNLHDRDMNNYITGSYTSQPINCHIDVTSMKFKRLRIWNIVNGVETLVFDGRAALKNGVYGIYDTVSQTMLTNPNITMVGE